MTTMKLLNPGPVSMTERVRRALASEDVCHREPEFRDLVASVRTRLAAVYGEKGFTPVLVGGSGTSAVETMLSLVGKSETSLVVANGVYGERMAAMLKAQGKAHEVVGSPWTSGMSRSNADWSPPLHASSRSVTGRSSAVRAGGAGGMRVADCIARLPAEHVGATAWIFRLTGQSAACLPDWRAGGRMP